MVFHTSKAESEAQLKKNKSNIHKNPQVGCEICVKDPAILLYKTHRKTLFFIDAHHVTYLNVEKNTISHFSKNVFSFFVLEFY